MRRTSLAVAGVLIASAVPARSDTPADRAGLDLLDHPLTCTFRTVQAGQFHALDFASGPLGGSSVLTIAASADDRRDGRVALIEEDRASVAGIVIRPDMVVLVDVDGGDAATILSLFTVARQGSTIPAALSRQALIGSIPVIIQSAGTCTPG